jgi:zinc protease
LEKAGSEGLNAYTTNDVTVYVQELPSKELPLIVELEADRMSNLIINDQSFKTEVEVVQNERRLRKENNPDGTLFQELFSTAFQKHPYHWPVIGYAEDLAAMSAMDAKAFYEKFYRPENAVIVISGSVNPKKALKLIEEKYPKTTPEFKIRTYMDEPEQTKARQKTIKLPIQIEKILVGFKTAPFNSSEFAAIQVLESVLSDGKSSRLSRALVDSGLATYAGAFQMENLDAGLFVISAGAQKGKTAKECEKVILNEIEQLVKNGISEIELKRAKNKILFSFYSSLESNSSRAEFLGKFEVGTGHYKNGYDRLKEIESITSEKIQEVVKKFLRPEKRTTIIGVPQ